MAPGGSLSSDSASNNPNEGVLPEKEEYKIELKKDGNGLGITIAGYVCEKGKEIQKKISSFHIGEITEFFCHSNFYVKSSLENPKVLKLPFLPFWGV